MSSTADSPFLTQLGLTNESFRATEGKVAADMLVTSLTYLTNPTVSLDLRTDIARLISKWQERASTVNKIAGFQQSYSKIIETIHQLLQEPDGLQPALHLAQALAKEIKITPISSFGKSALSQFMGMFQSACSGSTPFVDGSIIVEIMKSLVECFPNTGNAVEEINSIVTLLLQLFFRINAAPTLKGCTAHKLFQLLQAEQSATTSMHKPSLRSSSVTTLLETHLDSVLQAIQQGHPEFTSLVLANKTVCSVKSVTIEKNLPKMIELMGFAACEGVILGLVEVEPSKLLPSLPALVQELHNPHTLIGQKVTLLGVLLSVLLAQGAVPLAPFLDNMGEACRDVPELYIPLFKVLTTVAIGSPEEVTLKALVLVSNIAKNALYKSPSIQAAILDCVNILKDQCKYSNLFHSDTLNVFETLSVHNQAAYKNIIQWNSGKSAKKGNNADFILNAGKVTNDAVSPAGGIRSWFGSPKKAKSGSSGSASNSNANTPTHAGHVQYSAEVRGPESVYSPHGHNTTHNVVSSPSTHSVSYMPHSPYSTPSKGNSIAPSPHSQNLALMQQQLYAQQQQLQHQMLLVQQMQIQEQLAQFQSVGSVGEAVGGSNIQASLNSHGGAGGISDQLLQSPTFLPPNISIPNYAQSPHYNHNPYELGVQSLSQPSVPLYVSPPPPQYPLNAHEGYASDSFIHSPVNNVYNKNYSAPISNNNTR